MTAAGVPARVSVRGSEGGGGSDQAPDHAERADVPFPHIGHVHFASVEDEGRPSPHHSNGAGSPSLAARHRETSSPGPAAPARAGPHRATPHHPPARAGAKVESPKRYSPGAASAPEARASPQRGPPHGPLGYGAQRHPSLPGSEDSSSDFLVAPPPRIERITPRAKPRAHLSAKPAASAPSDSDEDIFEDGLEGSPHEPGLGGPEASVEGDAQQPPADGDGVPPPRSTSHVASSEAPPASSPTKPPDAPPASSTTEPSHALPPTAPAHDPASSVDLPTPPSRTPAQRASAGSSTIGLGANGPPETADAPLLPAAVLETPVGVPPLNPKRLVGASTSLLVRLSSRSASTPSSVRARSPPPSRPSLTLSPRASPVPRSAAVITPALAGDEGPSKSDTSAGPSLLSPSQTPASPVSTEGESAGPPVPSSRRVLAARAARAKPPPKSALKTKKAAALGAGGRTPAGGAGSRADEAGPSPAPADAAEGASTAPVHAAEGASVVPAPPPAPAGPPSPERARGDEAERRARTGLGVDWGDRRGPENELKSVHEFHSTPSEEWSRVPYSRGCCTIS